MKNPIYPCLWFDGNAKDAAEFYCSIFEGSRINQDTPMVVTWELAGQKFMGLNGGPRFQINPSISFFINCDSAEEADAKWAKLVEGGRVLMPLDTYEWSPRYGWLQDRFGVSWQVYLGKPGDVSQKICPSLMFTRQAGRAEEAVRYYTSVFDNSSIAGILKYGPGEDEKEGYVKHAQFTLNGKVFMAMDSSAEHGFAFNEGVSFVVDCANQGEIDKYWNTLTEGGKESMCGWLEDRFGVSWQIVPAVLGQLMSDPRKAPRVMSAFLKMKKFNIEELVNA